MSESRLLEGEKQECGPNAASVSEENSVSLVSEAWETHDHTALSGKASDGQKALPKLANENNEEVKANGPVDSGNENERDSSSAQNSTGTALDHIEVNSSPIQLSEDAAEDDTNQIKLEPKDDTKNQMALGHLHPTIIHFQSLSVNRWLRDDVAEARGSLRLVETDFGDIHDFNKIEVELIWSARSSGADCDKGNNDAELRTSIDSILTLRLDRSKKDPRITFHLHGGALWTTFTFPNGPDAMASFVKALDRHVTFHLLDDPYLGGELHYVESVERMRRVARPIFDPAIEEISDYPDDGSDSNNREVRRSGHQTRMQNSGLHSGKASSDNLGMTVLEQFARVTQVTRDFKEMFNLAFNDERRKEEHTRKEREKRARDRALDINAQIVASSEDEQLLPPRFTLDKPRGVPVTKAVWQNSVDKDGRLQDPTVMRQAIFSGGIEPNLRLDVWPILLGVFDWNSSRSERNEVLQKKAAVYTTLKAIWEETREAARTADTLACESDEQAQLPREERVSKYHANCLENEEQIEKDVLRTDRAIDVFAQDDANASRLMGDILNVYALYDSNIRYCQGMSDFLSPLIYYIGSEHEELVFWCFESLMSRIERNFRVNQSGMHAQLNALRELMHRADPGIAQYYKDTDPDYYTCFRWLLVCFKRELSYEGTARLWEVLWTRHDNNRKAGSNFHICIAAGLLMAHRRKLLGLPRGEFDTLLRYINDMSSRIDVDFALKEGELCFRKYGKVT